MEKVCVKCGEALKPRIIGMRVKRGEEIETTEAKIDVVPKLSEVNWQEFVDNAHARQVLLWTDGSGEIPKEMQNKTYLCCDNCHTARCLALI